MDEKKIKEMRNDLDFASYDLNGLIALFGYKNSSKMLFLNKTRALAMADSIIEIVSHVKETINNEVRETEYREGFSGEEKEFSINVNVKVQSNGKLDLFLAEESSSGLHYENVSPETVGKHLVEEIKSIIENR